ncbi:MAG: hypothetical protein RLZZ34_1336 [Verrucomicrobiota bacterium]
MDATVIAALRRFLPDARRTGPPLSQDQGRAVWALTHCRTPALGGRAFVCQDCRRAQFAWHSCNHKACPQCGRQATADWVARELRKRIVAPYFLVTFTLPAQLRGCFFGPHAREAYDLFFAAVSAALAEKLSTDKGFRAQVHGFTAVLHTWNQRLLFHPHLHCLVPGVGLDPQGQLVRVRQPDFLVFLPHLRAAFRQHLRHQLDSRGWQVDPVVWTLDWGVQIQPVGSGAAAIKYLGTYVARTAIGDSRIQQVTDHGVTFHWRDRSDGNRLRSMTLSGVEFVGRYLRHVLPTGLRSIRYYGFCHPAARANRLRIQFLAGQPVDLGAATSELHRPPPPVPCCSRCQGVLRWVADIPAPYRQRGPPSTPPPPQAPQPSIAA